MIRIDGDSEACYSCLCWHQYRGSMPRPNSVDAEFVQPAGCSAPTFTGTGFDVSTIALQGARVAVGALMRGIPGGYPEDGFDVHVLTLRDEQGKPCPPAWEGFHLERHPECGYHGHA